MCGTYYVDDDTLNEIEKVIREVNNKLNLEHYRKDIHPTELAPIINKDNTGLTIIEQNWGFPGFVNKGTIFNARSETVMDKRMFRNGINMFRVVIPAKHFYEWNRRKEKNTFTRYDGKQLFLAGFYDTFEGVDRFIILTTPANESVIKVHDRMPLVLEEDQVKDWICNDSLTYELLHQVPVLLNRTSIYEQQTLFE